MIPFRVPDQAEELPWLTVVMPVHSGEQWIEATLQSLADQAEPGLEVILLDSSPNDATMAIAQSYSDRLRLHAIHRPDVPGWHAKTNIGVEMARAEHACILHQDDLWRPGRAAAVRRWIAQAPEAALHLAPTEIIDRDGRRRGVWRCPLSESLLAPSAVIERLLVQNFVPMPSPVFRRDSWLACGGMDTDLWYTCDWDIWLKLAAIGPVRYSREITTSFRIHGSSLTMTGSRNAAEFESQMRTVLDRHLPKLPKDREKRIGRIGRASIRVNVALALASRGELRRIVAAAWDVLSLGPRGIALYLRDSRILERALPRLRARLAGGL